MGTMIRTLFSAVALAVSFQSPAFDLKGHSPGQDVKSVDLKSCKPIPDVDSGVAGYTCISTFGGDAAELRIGVFENQLVFIFYDVEGGQAQPIVDALSEKYGRAERVNRYNHEWLRGTATLSIVENRNGYVLRLWDRVLFEKASAASTRKAKKAS